MPPNRLTQNVNLPALWAAKSGRRRRAQAPSSAPLPPSARSGQQCVRPSKLIQPTGFTNHRRSHRHHRWTRRCASPSRCRGWGCLLPAGLLTRGGTPNYRRRHLRAGPDPGSGNGYGAGRSFWYRSRAAGPG
jgi:hypothetical protein